MSIDFSPWVSNVHPKDTFLKKPSTGLKSLVNSFNLHRVGHSQNLGGIPDSSSFPTLLTHLTHLQALSILPPKYLLNQSTSLPLNCYHTGPSHQRALLASYSSLLTEFPYPHPSTMPYSDATPFLHSSASFSLHLH